MIVYRSWSVDASKELVVNTVTGENVQVEPEIYHNIPDKKMPYFQMYCYGFAKEELHQ